jgi:hypothetical protein
MVADVGDLRDTLDLYRLDALSADAVARAHRRAKVLT